MRVELAIKLTRQRIGYLETRIGAHGISAEPADLMELEAQKIVLDTLQHYLEMFHSGRGEFRDAPKLREFARSKGIQLVIPDDDVIEYY